MFTCPPQFDTIAYRGRFYPWMYPARPGPDVQPQRCFRSSAEAEQAGYRLASTPRGAVRVDDIYLVPPERSLRTQCRGMARIAGLPVPCPTLVPVPAGSVDGCTGLRRCVSRGMFVLEGNFNGPPGYVGAEGRNGHLWIFAAVASKASQIECCAGRRTTASFKVRRHRAAWLEYPPGSELNSGHVLLEWQERGIVYAVSLHGHTDLNRKLDALLARRLQMVTPASS